MTALTETEQATLDRIEAAPAAEESLRERVARVLFEFSLVADARSVPWDVAQVSPFMRDTYLGMADAAIATMRGQQ